MQATDPPDSSTPATPLDLAALPGGTDRLTLLHTFVRIVEAGSLSAAAAQLGATQPTVSRRLKALEAALGVRLLQRSTHALRLTDDGARCVERAQALLDGWQAMEAELRDEDGAVEGQLRVVVPHAFGQQQLIAPLERFLAEHPRVSVEWLLRDDLQSLVTEGVDCAVQVGEVRDPAAVAIRLAEVPRIVVAAPSLAAQVTGQVGAGAEPAALAALPWLALKTYYQHELTLRHRADGRRERLALRPRIATDSLYALRTTALRGIGVAAISSWLVGDDLAAGRLVHLVPAWEADPLPVFLAYRPTPLQPVRLRRFIAAMRSAFAGPVVS